jgi:hypothetical protein
MNRKQILLLLIFLFKASHLFALNPQSSIFQNQLLFPLQNITIPSGYTFHTADCFLEAEALYIPDETGIEILNGGIIPFPESSRVILTPHTILQINGEAVTFINAFYYLPQELVHH